LIKIFLAPLQLLKKVDQNIFGSTFSKGGKGGKGGF